MAWCKHHQNKHRQYHSIHNKSSITVSQQNYHHENENNNGIIHFFQTIMRKYN